MQNALVPQQPQKQMPLCAVHSSLLLVAVTVLVAALVGCSGRPSVLPNRDKALRKSSAEFAADAAKRQYPADTPTAGEAVARAQVGYSLNRIDVVNLSDEDWQDLEIWVNERYSVHLPQMKRGQLYTLNFQMLYDNEGKYFPISNKKTLVNKVEVLRNGARQEIPVRLGD